MYLLHSVSPIPFQALNETLLTLRILIKHGPKHKKRLQINHRLIQLIRIKRPIPPVAERHTTRRASLPVTVTATRPDDRRVLHADAVGELLVRDGGAAVEPVVVVVAVSSYGPGLDDIGLQVEVVEVGTVVFVGAPGLLDLHKRRQYQYVKKV